MAFGQNLLACDMRTVEPAWKMFWSNKEILPILWQLFPDHPNLLPAYFEAQKFTADIVKKSLLSREGANIGIYAAGLAPTLCRGLPGIRPDGVGGAFSSV